MTKIELSIFEIPYGVVSKFDDPDGYLVFDDTTKTVSNADKTVSINDTEYNEIITNMLSSEW